jgi:DNA gyrase/topoisomerase IV subunit A
MDDLIARIKPVYDRIRDERFALLQHDTLLQINRMIETISELLENVHARDEVRNMALVELQKIKKAIELDRHGRLISKQREIAEEAFEKAQDIVFSQS